VTPHRLDLRRKITAAPTRKTFRTGRRGPRLDECHRRCLLRSRHPTGRPGCWTVGKAVWATSVEVGATSVETVHPVA